jgi:hypothetical protein
MEFKNYNDLEEGLKGLPATWYPALIISIVEIAYHKNVFVPGGASHLIQNAEERIGQEKK